MGRKLRTPTCYITYKLDQRKVTDLYKPRGVTQYRTFIFFLDLLHFRTLLLKIDFRIIVFIRIYFMETLQNLVPKYLKHCKYSHRRMKTQIIDQYPLAYFCAFSVSIQIHNKSLKASSNLRNITLFFICMTMNLSRALDNNPVASKL